MSSIPDLNNSGTDEDIFDDFLKTRGHTVDNRDWDESHKKKQCPVCGGIHSQTADACESCGWQPVTP